MRQKSGVVSDFLPIDIVRRDVGLAALPFVCPCGAGLLLCHIMRHKRGALFSVVLLVAGQQLLDPTLVIFSVPPRTLYLVRVERDSCSVTCVKRVV